MAIVPENKRSRALRRPLPPRAKTLLCAAALFCLCVTLFFMMRNNIRFMDEMDNFSVGLQMTQGGTLYVSLFSQHMPLMYYISALLARLGARSVLSFRLCWYVLLSLCYVALYLRYAKWYGRVPLLLWPVFYLCSITTVPLCTSILAEQLQAVGMVMLLLEFLHYTKTHEVSRASAVCIALAINLSFLSAFVAAFACAGIVLGYILCEVSLCVRAHRSFGASVRYLWKKYRLTIILTLAPMLLFALWFGLNGMWSDFWYKAVTFNTQVYSEYQNGFGASPLSALLGCVTQYVAWVKTLIQTLFQGAASVPAAVALLFAAQYVFLLVLVLKKRVYTAAVVQVFFLLCGSRGFYNYHSLQCFALGCVMLALLCGLLWRGAWEDRQKAALAVPADARGALSGNAAGLGCGAEKAARAASFPGGQMPQEAKNGVRRACPSAALRVCCGALFVVCCGAFLLAGGTFFWQHRMSVLPTELERNPVYDAHSNEVLLQALTDDGEYILQNINSEDLFLETHVRAPSYNTAPSPWWWAATRADSMADITANPPRVAIYDPLYTAFGEYVVEDFAPELDAFVHKNYTLLYSDAPYFYVRNDYLSAARAKLPADDSDMVGSTKPNITCGDALALGEVRQHFIAARGEIKTLSIQFGTHSRPYTGTVHVALTDDATGKMLREWTVDGADMMDNAFTFVQSGTDAPIPLKAGAAYTLTLTAQPRGDANITVWAAADEATATNFAETADGAQQYNLRIKVR
ncbi:MAG: hypothetical protein RSD62_01120 [Ruthenibacterium sp.]